MLLWLVMWRVGHVGWLVGLVFVACGDGGHSAYESAAPPPAAAGNEGGAGEAGTVPSLGDGGTSDAASCDPPDMLIVLDRTQTMHSTPDGTNPPLGSPQLSKFWQAITSIKTLVTPPRDATIRFGLELWPRDPGKDANGVEECITLLEKIGNTRQTSNPSCEGPDIPVSPDLNTGPAIQALLDPLKTHLCNTTPTGAALQGAMAKLAQMKVKDRAQSMILVTDGADWNVSCPLPDPRDVVTQAAAQGVSTFVVGFDAQKQGGINAGVGKSFLNDMACAGKTATGFATACRQDPDAGSGYRAVDPNGPPIFLLATSANELDAALQSAAGSVCCDCTR